jgi:hypothetical protein
LLRRNPAGCPQYLQFPMIDSLKGSIRAHNRVHSGLTHRRDRCGEFEVSSAVLPAKPQPALPRCNCTPVHVHSGNWASAAEAPGKGMKTGGADLTLASLSLAPAV